jgi:hypothetical protein
VILRASATGLVCPYVCVFVCVCMFVLRSLRPSLPERALGGLDASALDWLCSEHGHANHASWDACVKCSGDKAQGLHHLQSTPLPPSPHAIRWHVFPRRRASPPLGFEQGQRLWACGACGSKNSLDRRECSKCAAEAVHSKGLTASLPYPLP